MKLKAKISVFLTALIIIFGIISFVIQTQILLPSYQKIEEEENTEIINICITFIQDELEYLRLLAKDWANWDSCYDFAIGKNTNTFINDNLPNSLLKDVKLDLMFFYNDNNKIIWSSIDKDSTLKETPIILFNSIFIDNDLLFNSEKPLTQITGILSSPY